MKRCLVPLLGVFILVGCATQEPAPTPVRRAEIWRSPIADSPPGAGQIPAVQCAADPRAGGHHDRRAQWSDTYQKNADNHIQVASTQKLLTALIILRRGNLDGRLQIATPDTFVEPAKLGLRPGQSYTRRMLLSAMMVKSENDAAAALARDHSGSISAFAAAMNSTAWNLGAHNSHFANPHGLPAYRVFDRA